MTPFHIPRRGFLRSAALIAAGSALPSWYGEAVPAPAPKPRASNRPGILLVGCGGMGLYDLSDAAKFGDPVALCDVDASRLAKAGQQYPKARRFRDFREAIRSSGVDVVINGTPDHWHTPINLFAVRNGRDVYSEKPLTLTLDEGKRLVNEVRTHRRILQTGSQQRSDRRFQFAVDLVRTGRLGRIRRVISSLPAGRHGGPFQVAPVPEGFDWDLWQGPVQSTAYVPERGHGNFRYWWDYSEGTLTDWGAHHNDITRWMIGADGPVTVEGRALIEPIPGGFSFPANYRVEFTYAGGIHHVCQSTVCDSPSGERLSPPLPGEMPHGVRVEGTDGWLFVSRGVLEASDAAILQDPASKERSGKSHEDHMGNFFECVRTRRAPTADAETGHRSVSLCHLGAIAMRLGRPLRWNPKSERFVGDREADTHLAREPRKPYDDSYIA